MNHFTASRNDLMVTMVFVIVCFAACASFADQETHSVEVLPNWTSGEKVTYELVKTRRKTQGQLVTADITTLMDVEIEVLSVDANGSKLAWTFGETKFEDPKFANNPVIKQMSNLLKGHRVILELDSQAAILGVENWKELKNTNEQAMETLMEVLTAQGVDAEMIKKLHEQVMSMFATKEKIEQLCIREAQMMYMAVGIELEPSKPLVFQDQLPNPFGGEPFPTQAQFALTSVDRDLDRATIKWTQTFLPEESSRIMQDTLKNLAARLGNPVPEQDKLMGFTVEDQAEFVFEASTGWIQHATHKRATKAGDNSQEDTVTFKRKSK